MRFNLFASVILILAFIASSCASNNDHHIDFNQLELDLNNLTQDFRGDAGIYVKHIPTGREISIQADTIFPTASMIKVPLTVRIAELVDQGELSYDSLHTYEDRLYYPGVDVVAAMKEGEAIALRKMVFLSLSFSDNTASLWMQELGGTGTMVNEAMERLGLEHTRVNSRTEGRQDDFRRYGWGQTTPREMANLVEMIYNGEVINPERSEEIYRLMTKTLWDEAAIAEIPKTVTAASKQGSVSASKSEVVLVNAPAGDYVFTVITKNQEDRSSGIQNEGFELIRSVSRALWDALGE
ncbi:MAG: class A beta-lactamase-related serine hydrolase [Balneolales bacterium]|nr:class A beta-lactamase-related serine hydrolase [Balneolales bacterium]